MLVILLEFVGLPKCHTFPRIILVTRIGSNTRTFTSCLVLLSLELTMGIA
jgi:hypothetical protein